MELSVATISRWICKTIADFQAAFKNSKSASVKAYEVQAVATSSQLFNKVDLQAVRKAGRLSRGGTFTSFYLRNSSSQADSLRKTGHQWQQEEWSLFHPARRIMSTPFKGGRHIVFLRLASALASSLTLRHPLLDLFLGAPNMIPAI